MEGLAAHKRARLGIGYVPQGRDVFPRMSVADNLAVGASLLAAGTPFDIERAYGPFPILRERRAQRAGTMSGAAAAACDRPRPRRCTIPDPARRAVRGHPALGGAGDRPHPGGLNRRTGVTVVFVEQNLDLIRAMAQRSYVMDKGRIVAELTARDLDDRDLVRRHLAV